MSDHIVAGERLIRRLEQSAEIAGCRIRIVHEACKPWEAALFMGGLHELTITVDGQTGAAWLDCLDENAICVPGFVLSKLEVSSVEVRLSALYRLEATIEAETVREA